MPPEEKNKPVDRPQTGEWIKGNPDASIVLIEYSDLQCPACKTYQSYLKRIMDEYGDRVALVFRHFPLESAHPNAVSAALAAEAAGMQGKFWEMEELLYDRQTEWANSDARSKFISYAEELGLNVEKFKSDMDSKQTKVLVKADQNSGFEQGIQGTPTFFLNGKKLDVVGGYDGLKQLIEEKLAQP
ncbi:hypothetical protein AUK40_03610 [Candidatus Wirthbacteria bacterium CG2_30_54_11]|uniref:Thioredoxin domain-containing protein n=1 Tax=Candidatus Wirthbacteria bacterium CG2_30_54_11 TaxID=1817892 RepID=A0A1J5IJG1_9BACT|nr:MAG: hypothetical protein AUK40_03610 [Candidatus Wirthbacteria bacterium CG2_30_54_11]